MPTGDSNQRLKLAYGAVFFVACLSTIAGVMAEVFHVPFFVNMGTNYESIIVGVVFFVLGWLVKRRSMIALGIAFFLFALNTILLVINMTGQGQPLPIGGMLGRFFILFGMIRGFGAIRALKAEFSRNEAEAKASDQQCSS